MDGATVSTAQQAARTFLRALVESGDLEVNADFEEAVAADTLLDRVSETDEDTALGAALAATVADLDGVEELYSDDAKLERLFAQSLQQVENPQ